MICGQNILTNRIIHLNPTNLLTMKEFSFEKLIVWQRSRVLAKNIYVMTKSFPKAELFGLTGQMRRCSVSIASNIAEGSGRHSPKDRARFSEIAYSSALELLNQTIISYDLEYIFIEDYRIIRTEIEEITFLINGLYKSQIKLI